MGSLFSLKLPARAVAARAGPPLDDAAPGEALGPLRVLVAEDNLVNQRVIRAMLRTLGFEVTTASNGAEAERFAGAVDLILMDCHMPTMDGIEATRRIRDRGVGVPIIALTADTLQDTREQCLDAGMDAVLYKPVKKDLLQDTLLDHLAEEEAIRSA